MANRNAKEKQAIKESVVLSDIDAGKGAKPNAEDKAKAKAESRKVADQKITARQRRDVGNKIARRETAKARAASPKPVPAPVAAPRRAPRPGAKPAPELSLPVPPGAVDQIKRGKAKKVLATISDQIVNKGKAGTRNATARQRRQQKAIDLQGAQVAEQQRAQQLQDKFEGNVMSATERRNHEFVIAKAIRLQGHLNDPVTQKSVAALGTKHAGYIAGREFERIANEK